MRRLVCTLALPCLVAFLTSCGDVEPSARVVIDAPTSTSTTMHTTTATTISPAVKRWYDVALWNDVVRFNDAVRKNAEAASRSLAASTHSDASTPKPTTSGSAASVHINSQCQGVVLEWLQQYFGADLAWATRAAWRESRCGLGAFNPEGCDTSGRTHSHAYGPMQMCSPLHEGDYAAVGCPGMYRDDLCGVKAAAHLYARAGRGPWGG